MVYILQHKKYGGHKMPSDAPSNPGICLLVADDNPFILDLVQVMLAKLNHPEAVFATNGLEAVAAWKEQPFDMILMDCQMPDMDGYEATRSIRKLESESTSRQPTTIIAMTGDATQTNRALCREVGMDMLLSKPFTINDFKILLKSDPRALRRTEKMTTQTIERVSGPAKELDAVDWSVIDALKVLRKPGKPDVREILINSYLSSSPPLLDRVKAAVTAADGHQLMSAAHSIKSSSVAIGALAFGKTCFELEQFGRANNLDDAPAVLSRAENEFSAVCSALRTALEQIG
jgi:CheY-like chemotaxis protein